jgi:hypothetical protein
MKDSGDSGKVCKIVAVKRCCNPKVRVNQPPVSSSTNRNVSSTNRNVSSTDRNVSNTNKDTQSNQMARDVFNIPKNDTDLERMFGDVPDNGMNILEFGKSDKDLTRELLGPSVDDLSFCERLAQCNRNTERSLDVDSNIKDRGVLPPPPPPGPPLNDRGVLPPPPPPIEDPIFNAPPIGLDVEPKQYTSECPPNQLTNDCMLNRMGNGMRPDRTANQPGNNGHDPRGLRFGFDGSRMPTEEEWVKSKWDGVPFLNGKWRERQITPAFLKEVLDFLAPAGRPMIRGMHDLYYNSDPVPFLDKYNPTTIEIDAWNIRSINHVRALLGETVKVQPDARLYLETKWANEMSGGTKWHAKYGDQCGDKGGHCGADFQPDSADRLAEMSCPPYNLDFVKYPELKDYHIFTASQPKNHGTNDSPVGTDARVPWSLRMATVMVNQIVKEGYVGHPGPFLTKRFVGMNWSCAPGGQAQMGGVGARLQWI